MFVIKIVSKKTYATLTIVKDIPDRKTAEHLMSYIIAHLYNVDFCKEVPENVYEITESVGYKTNKNIDPSSEDLGYKTYDE